MPVSTLLTDGSSFSLLFLVRFAATQKIDQIVFFLKRVCQDKISNLFALIALFNRYNETSCFSEENRDQDQALNNCTENGKDR